MTQPPIAGRPDADPVRGTTIAQGVSSPDALAAESEGASAASEGIRLFEEQASIAKRRVDAGAVRVDVRTHHHDELVRTTLDGEVLEVVRIPIDKVVERAPDVRVEGDLTIVPVLEEVLVVEKRLVLREELHVRRRATRETFEQPVTLRRQEVAVERIGAADDGLAASGDAS